MSQFLQTHDLLSAFDHLVSSAREHIIARVTTHTVATAPRKELMAAAVAFTAQLAIECGYDVQLIRGLEYDLIKRLETP